MKTHLFRPGELVTMCGIQIKSFSTKDPTQVDCARCKGMYVVNIDWYWQKLSGPVPPATKWADVDTPMFYPVKTSRPFDFSWQVIIKEWALDYSLRKEAGDSNVLRS